MPDMVQFTGLKCFALKQHIQVRHTLKAQCYILSVLVQSPIFYKKRGRGPVRLSLWEYRFSLNLKERNKTSRHLEQRPFIKSLCSECRQVLFFSFRLRETHLPLSLYSIQNLSQL